MKINPFPGEVTKQVVKRPYIRQGQQFVHRVTTIILTSEQEDWLRTYFPMIENKRLMKLSGLKDSSLHRFARELGLKKSEEGLHAILKRQAVRSKRINEKSGYYDSIRGRSCPEWLRAATIKMWQEIKEGKRESPLAVMKREHPRKYRLLQKRKSETRKEVARKERLRIKYGMQRKTKMKVALYPFTRSQVCHRLNALKRGYFYAEDCSEGGGCRYDIYYDDNTRRTEKFEKNLVKDGFNVLRY
jgi:hypothetical protein